MLDSNYIKIKRGLGDKIIILGFVFIYLLFLVMFNLILFSYEFNELMFMM